MASKFVGEIRTAIVSQSYMTFRLPFFVVARCCCFSRHAGVAINKTMILRVLLLLGFGVKCRRGLEFNQEEIDSLMYTALGCRRDANPGLAVSVVKDGKVMFAKGYGVTDVKTRRPVTNSTLFGIASVSKAFAAILMVKLLHDRNMSVYTKISDVLKEGFEFADPFFTQHATIEDLMTHRIGIPGNRGMRLDTNLTRKDIARRFRYFDPVRKFRASYLYSNMNYGLLTYLSEVLTGKAWEDLVTEYIFKPLDMLDSDFLLRVDRSTRDVAQGYIADEVNSGKIPVPEEVNRLWGLYAGSGGIMSSSGDVTKWMLMQLRGGRNEKGKEVFRPGDLRLTHLPQIAIHVSDTEMFQKPKAPFSVVESNYALGWKTGTYKDWKVLRHSGSTFGYSSLITLVPGANLGIFTGSTGHYKDQVTKELLHSYLSDVFLGEQRTINKTTVCTYPEPWYTLKRTKVKPIVKTSPPSRELSKYVGVYNHAAYGNLVVSLNSTIQKLQMEYGIGHWILYPETKTDKFQGETFGIMYKLYDLRNIQFHGNKNDIDTVEVLEFEPLAPPRFKKIGRNSYHNEL